MLTKEDFDFDLDKSLIAEYPFHPRSQSRLMHIQNGKIANHLKCIDLPDLLNENDLLIVNNTKVLLARMYGHKLTGGKVELLIEKILSGREALVRLSASRPIRIGDQLRLTSHQERENKYSFQVVDKDGVFYKVLFSSLVDEVMENCGDMPIPPYIKRSVDLDDKIYYQSIFSKKAGSVAASTASLHFDDSLLLALEKKLIEIAEVTLHIGSGTFQPIYESELSKHHMHRESYEISDELIMAIERCWKRKGRIVAVGTTVVRALESWMKDHELKSGIYSTNLFIQMNYPFKIVNALLTNFHLPQSTLLILVSAFAGKLTIEEAYQKAVEMKYRFFSYGDAMFIERNTVEEV